MKRKVNLVGQNTLTVSLPSNWVKKNQIVKGDELEIVEKDNSLILLGKGKIPDLKKTIDINLEEMNEDSIRLILNNLFRAGVDVLRIHFKDAKKFEEVQRISDRRFIGFEITKKEDDYCILENVTVPDSSKFNTLSHRAFLIVNESMLTILEDMKKCTFANMGVINHQFEKVEQYLNFCMRSINNQDVPLKDLNFYFMVFYLLRIMEGSLEQLYESLAVKKKISIGKDTINYFEELQTSYNQFYRSFYERDINKLSKLNEQIRKLLFNNGYSIITKKKGHESIVLHHMIDVNRILSLTMSPTLKIVL